MSTKEIDIQRQPRLGFARTLSITLNGIKYRLFRSSVTLVVVTVAIAFLMNILAEGMIKASIVDVAQERLTEFRAAAYWASRLTVAPSLQGVLGDLVKAQWDDSLRRELAGFGQMDEEEMERVVEQAVATGQFVGFLEALDYGRLRLLTGGRRGIGALDVVSEGAGRSRMMEQLARMPTLRVPLDENGLESVLDGWPELRDAVGRVRQGHGEAIARVQERLGGKTVLSALTEADGWFGEQIREGGFALSETQAMNVALRARLEAASARVDAALDKPEVRRAVASRRDLLPLEVTAAAVWPLVSDARGAEWFAGLAEGAPEPEVLVEISGQMQDVARMERIEPLAAEVGGGFLGVGERMSWLILLSLVVCSVGIANAMLMSVTERYREIATFKCLGALDGSIMLIFVIEAALLGSVGGLLGALVGAMLAVGGALFMYGSLVLVAMPWTGLFVCVVLSIVAGVVLAAAASIYPSYKAARLAPMEAMRIE